MKSATSSVLKRIRSETRICNQPTLMKFYSMSWNLFHLLFDILESCVDVKWNFHIACKTWTVVIFAFNHKMLFSFISHNIHFVRHAMSLNKLTDFHIFIIEMA